MPEHDSDKLEHFFQKAASRPDISFNEDDWKKLEARLDVQGPDLSVAEKAGSKMAGAFVLSVLLILTGMYWSGDGLDSGREAAVMNNAGVMLNGETAPAPDSQPSGAISGPVSDEDKAGAMRQKGNQESEAGARVESRNNIPQASVQHPSPLAGIFAESGRHEDLTTEHLSEIDHRNETGTFQGLRPNTSAIGVVVVDHSKISEELIRISPANADKIKQKAGVELPGAEEVDDSREVVAIVKEEDASDKKKHLATPRLSLLLSLAPDFSSTSSNQYIGPGEAFGAMIHYHIKDAWSISAGIVRSNKRYTGEGGDYKPPKGYWKYYTNGIIPYSIDGSCNVLEFPVMLQYTIAAVGKSKFLAGGGVSSYLMLHESYRYNFEQPNPGAREGWDSKNRSRFLFNMINLTVGFEHQIFPGFMIGVEPYVKIPVHEIGWSNLKLFSTGASLTLRYSILRKERAALQTRSRGPD